MAAAYAFLIAYSSQKAPDGQRRKLLKVDLDDNVDLGKAWQEMKGTMGGMIWGKQPSFPGANSKNVPSGGDNSASSSGKQGDPPKK